MRHIKRQWSNSEILQQRYQSLVIFYTSVDTILLYLQLDRHTV